ncbi:MAG: three-Cys-motif partner protein TcmP [Campylobacterales bacterium]|nr:three-Cys-motif partner protein TcmP [Campylobacterales bacterium]
MATIKQGNKNYLEEHSKVKVDFYKKYLDIYLTVLLNSPYTTKICIYDIFCGIGVYEGDNSKGSPIVAIESIKSSLEKFGRDKIDNIELVINDGDLKHVSIAKEYIEKNYNNICKFEAYNLDAKKMIDLLKHKLAKSTNRQNNFIFIDPHGYKEIYKSDVSDIMDLGKNEILIFLPIDNMYRFIKPAKEDETNPSFKPLKRFMNEFELNYSASSKEQYIEYIKNALTYNNLYYTSSFILESKPQKNKYALFFITKNLKGLEESIKIKWKLDEICGKGHQEQLDLGLFGDIFKESELEDCLLTLENKLKVFLKEYKNNLELYEFILKSGFLVKQATPILKKLEKQNKLLFIDNFERKQKSYYLSYQNYKQPIKYKVKINEY